jgi:hypothetical protein
MRKQAILRAIVILLLLMGTARAGPATDKNAAPFPGTLVNARYVYVTSYDGDQFNPGVLPQDRRAIAAVQDAVEKWGKWVVVYKPQEADVVLMVMSRPSEDVLAVYDSHGWPNNEFLWRVSAREGLQKNETPLFSQMRKAFEKAAAK